MSRFGRDSKPKTRKVAQPVRSPTGTVLKAIDADMESMIGDFDVLPTMPTVLANIQSALQSGRSDAQHVAKLVGSDVALTAQNQPISEYVGRLQEERRGEEEQVRFVDGGDQHGQ